MLASAGDMALACQGQPALLLYTDPFSCGAVGHVRAQPRDLRPLECPEPVPTFMVSQALMAPANGTALSRATALEMIEML